MMRVKKVFRKFCKLCQNILEKIGFRMMNLTEQEETILKRMIVEQETMRQSSVSFIITMDNTEIEEREKLMKKIQKDQEILERLDEVSHTLPIIPVHIWSKASYNNIFRLKPIKHVLFSGRYHRLLSPPLADALADSFLLESAPCFVFFLTKLLVACGS